MKRIFLIAAILLVGCNSQTKSLVEKPKVEQLKKQVEQSKSEVKAEKEVPEELEKPKRMETHNGTFKGYKVSEVKSFLEDSEYKGKKLAFLTFDDGFSSKTEKFLDKIKELKIPVTFFPIAKTLENESNHKFLKRAFDEGHSIGIHSYSHDYEVLYPGRVADVKEIERDTLQALTTFRKVLGNDFNTRVYRFPGGQMSWGNTEEAAKVLRKMNSIEWIDWNSMNGDAQSLYVNPEVDIPRPQTVEQSVENVFRSLSWNRNPNVAVVLMHETNDLTLESLEAIVARFKAEGFEFGVLE